MILFNQYHRPCNILKLEKDQSSSFCIRFTLPETKIAPENGWLEYDRFLLGWPICRGELLVSGRLDWFIYVLSCRPCRWTWCANRRPCMFGASFSQVLQKLQVILVTNTTVIVMGCFPYVLSSKWQIVQWQFFIFFSLPDTSLMSWWYIPILWISTWTLKRQRFQDGFLQLATGENEDTKRKQKETHYFLFLLHLLMCYCYCWICWINFEQYMPEIWTMNPWGLENDLSCDFEIGCQVPAGRCTQRHSENHQEMESSWSECQQVMQNIEYEGIVDVCSFLLFWIVLVYFVSCVPSFILTFFCFGVIIWFVCFFVRTTS